MLFEVNGFISELLNRDFKIFHLAAGGWVVFVKHTYYKNINESNAQAHKNENR